MQIRRGACCLIVTRSNVPNTCSACGKLGKMAVFAAPRRVDFQNIRDVGADMSVRTDTDCNFWRPFVKRLVLAPLIAAMLLSGTAALAQSAVDQIVERLRAENYGEIRVQRTLLGRIRVTATGKSGDREIVLNPSTGAILRDYHSGREDSAAPRSRTTTPQAANNSSGAGSSSSASGGSGNSSGKSSNSSGNNNSGGNSSGGNSSGGSGNGKDKSDKGNSSGKSNGGGKDDQSSLDHSTSKRQTA